MKLELLILCLVFSVFSFGQECQCSHNERVNSGKGVSSTLETTLVIEVITNVQELNIDMIERSKKTETVQKDHTKTISPKK